MSPKRDTVIAGSLASRITGFLAKHPDQQFRTFEIAAKIRCAKTEKQRQSVANELARLARRGTVSRVQVPASDLPEGSNLRGQRGIGAISFYSARSVGPDA